MNKALQSLVAGVSLAVLAGSAFAELSMGAVAKDPYARDFEEAARAEEQVPLPAFPKDGDLIEFYVSAATANHFYVDGATLAVGKDGVVRYALVVKTSGGATNVGYEGIRCNTGEYRLYATGRADGTWARVRAGTWRPIENKSVNRHHAALNRDIFCPVGLPVANAEEGRKALRGSWRTNSP